MGNATIAESYHVSFNTYLIEPLIHGDKLYSRVYDKNGEMVVSRKPIYIIRKSCVLMGSNYKTARTVSKRFFGDEKHKLPIIISHDYGMPCVFFPLLSPTSPNNVWVGLHAIINIRRFKDCTEITLKDGRELILNFNYSSFCTQYVCATMLNKFGTHQRLILQNDLSVWVTD